MIVALTETSHRVDRLEFHTGRRADASKPQDFLKSLVIGVADFLCYQVYSPIGSPGEPTGRDNEKHPDLIEERQVMNYRQLAGPTAMSVNEVLDQASSLQGEEVCIYGYFVGQFEHVALHHLPRIEARPPKKAEWGKLAGQDLLGSCIWVAAEKWKNLEALSRRVVYITGTVQFARWRIPPQLRRIATTYPRLFQLCWSQPFTQFGHFGRYPAAIKATDIRAFEKSEVIYEKLANLDRTT